MSDPLSPFSRQLVESARRAHEPDVGAKVRVRRSLDTRLAAAVVVGGSTLLGTLAKATSVVVLAASVVTGTVWVVRSQSKPPVVSEPAVAPRPAPSRALPAQPKLSPLEQELALLNAAQAALRAHQPAEALGKLEQHANAFPQGNMLQERQATRALALCELGRKSEARAVATNFVQSWPASPLVSRMNEVCVPSPQPPGAQPRGR